MRVVSRTPFFYFHDDICNFTDLESNIAGINEDIKSFDARLKFAADIQSAAEVYAIQ